MKSTALPVCCWGPGKCSNRRVGTTTPVASPSLVPYPALRSTAGKPSGKRFLNRPYRQSEPAYLDRHYPGKCHSACHCNRLRKPCARRPAASPTKLRMIWQSVVSGAPTKYDGAKYTPLLCSRGSGCPKHPASLLKIPVHCRKRAKSSSSSQLLWVGSLAEHTWPLMASLCALRHSIY